MRIQTYFRGRDIGFILLLVLAQAFPINLFLFSSDSWIIVTYTICLYNHRALHLKRERCSKCRKSKLCAGNSSNKFNWIYEFLSCSIQVWNSSSFSISFRSRLFFSCWKVYFSFQVAPFDNVDVVPNGEEFTLANTYLKAHFSDQGLLQVLWTLEEKNHLISFLYRA